MLAMWRRNLAPWLTTSATPNPLVSPPAKHSLVSIISLVSSCSILKWLIIEQSVVGREEVVRHEVPGHLWAGQWTLWCLGYIISTKVSTRSVLPSGPNNRKTFLEAILKTRLLTFCLSNCSDCDLEMLPANQLQEKRIPFWELRIFNCIACHSTFSSVKWGSSLDQGFLNLAIQENHLRACSKVQIPKSPALSYDSGVGPAHLYF